MKNSLVLVLASWLLISCNTLTGNGNVTTEERTLPAVQAINTSGSADVELEEGATYSMTVTDDQNLLPYLITEVQNGVLSIHYKKGYSVINGHAKVRITLPTLDKIRTSGSGDISGKGTLKSAGQLQMVTSGSGSFDLDVDAPSVKVSGSGSGDITLSGNTKNFDCRVSGSGDIECGKLKTENTEVHLSGSGDVKVFASVSLKVTITGSGDVRYGGNPLSPEFHITGSGTVKAEP